MRVTALLVLFACAPATPEGKGGPVVPPDDSSVIADSADSADSADTADSATTDSDPPVTQEEAELEGIGSPLLRFDPDPGLMDASFTLTLSSDLAGGQILYTLDGSDPRSSEGALTYTAPLAVEHTTVLRAALLEDDVAIGAVATGTWIFPDQVADQVKPEGWPDTWFVDYGGSVTYEALYTLTDEVVDEDPAAVVTALRALPVLSVVMAPEDLWGRTGIYDHTWMEGAEWERPVHVELLNTDNTWSADAGIRAYGGASRSPTGTPKKSFRVIFRADYGPTNLDVPLYSEDTAEVNSFIIRAGYNHSWVHWDPAQRSRAQYVRDRFARANQRAMGWAASEGVYVHVYLNGMYWGVYDLAERPDAHFFATAYGVDESSSDPDNWDVLNAGEPIDGDATAWNEALALARADDGSDESLAALEAMVDSDALMDYMLMNLWAGNTDWPYGNWYAGRARDGGLWRFSSWDAEHTLEGASDDVTSVADVGTPAELWQAFLKHPSFVARVSARAGEILGDGGLLSGTVALERFDAVVELVYPALLAESARWGNYRQDVYCYSSAPCPLYTVDGFWQTENTRLRTTVIPTRADTLATQLAARGWGEAP